MPIINVDATEWTYQGDLSAGSATYSCSFPDPPDTGIIPDESLFNGAATADRVQIKIGHDGHQEILLTGVADEYGLEETNEGLIGHLRGRDLQALMWEKYPDTPHTYPGIKVDYSWNGTSGWNVVLTPQTTFHNFVRDVANKVGFDSVVLDCPDYPIGTDITIGRSNTYGEVFLGVLEPLRWTEKYRVDSYVVNNTLYVVERSRNTASVTPTVQVPYANIITRGVVKSRLPAIPSTADVQIKGFTYQAPAGVTTDVTEGLTALAPYSKTLPTEKEMYGTTVIAQTDTTIWYDAKGRETGRTTIKRTFYYILVTGSYSLGNADPSQIGQVRLAATSLSGIAGDAGLIETTDHQITLITDVSSAAFGQPSSETTTNTVVNNSFKWIESGKDWKIDGVYRINQVMSKTETTYTYYEDNGDPRTIVSQHYQAEQPGIVGTITGSPAQGTPLARVRETREVFTRDGDRVKRITTVTEREKTGVVKTTTNIPEYSSGRRDTSKVTVGKGWLNATYRYESTQIKSSGNGLPVIFTTESPYLGSQSIVDEGRRKFLDERTSWKTSINLSLPFDMRVREGVLLQITGAPGRWATNTFLVIRRNIRGSPDGNFLEVTGVAWA